MATPTTNLDRRVSLGDVPFSLPFVVSETPAAAFPTTKKKRKEKKTNNSKTIHRNIGYCAQTMKKLKFAATWLTLPQITVKTIQLVRKIKLITVINVMIYKCVLYRRYWQF